MSFRVTTQVRRPMRLEAFSVLARSIRQAVYHREAPPSQADLWRLHHDLQAIAKSGHPEWIYNDRLHVVGAPGADMVVVDMRNSQYIGADISLPTFALGYEPDIGLAIDAFVPDDGVLLDVGANWGYFAVYLAVRPGFRGRVLALEPFPDSFRGLRTVIERLGLSGSVETLECAAGREAGLVAMSDEVFSGNNKIVAGEGGVAARQTPLDLVVEERGLSRVDFVKIDVEGAEVDAIAGAARTLRRFRPAVMFEDWFAAERPGAAFDALSAIGEFDFYVLDVQKPFRAPPPPAEPAAALDCLVTVSSLDASERDKWPDRINVLALPRGSDLAGRLGRAG